MKITVETHAQGCRLVIAGRMTSQFARQIEDRLIDAMRRHPRIELDLSGVDEIDHSGVHHLHQLKRLGGSGIAIVASSRAIDQASTAFALASGERRINRAMPLRAECH